jgi:hypothetical protein
MGDAATEGLLSYTVFMSGPGGQTIFFPAQKTVSRSVSPGTWLVTVQAFLPGNVLAGSGTARVTVQSGQIAYAVIVLDTAFPGIVIVDAAELLKIGTDPAYPLNGTYHLISDVEFSDWNPIGNSVTPFQGVFNGNNHTITINGFSAAALALTDIGFIGYADGARISNVTIDYPTAGTVTLSVGGTQNIGGAAGWTDNGTVLEGVTVSGTIDFRNTGADLRVGGLVGTHNNGVIKKCRSLANVHSFTSFNINYGGGIVGLNCSTVQYCYAAGLVVDEGGWIMGGVAGGIAGCNSTGGIIESCYFIGGADARAVGAASDTRAGGITGDNDSTISNCYSIGTVNSEVIMLGITAYAGGITGTGSSSITGCAALGPYPTYFGIPSSVNRITSSGGILNNNVAGSIMGGGAGSYTSPDGLLVTQSDWQYPQAASVNPYAAAPLNWDFENVWTWMPPYQYPVFRWQTEAP